MRGEECETCAEGDKVEDIITTRIVPSLLAAETTSERTSIRRARKDISPSTVLGFPQVSNAAD